MSHARDAVLEALIPSIPTLLNRECQGSATIFARGTRYDLHRDDAAPDFPQRLSLPRSSLRRLCLFPQDL